MAHPYVETQNLRGKRVVCGGRRGHGLIGVCGGPDPFLCISLEFELFFCVPN